MQRQRSEGRGLLHVAELARAAHVTAATAHYYDLGEVLCKQVADLVQRRRSIIRARIAELRALEARISDALSIWDDLDSQPRVDGEFCPLIDRLETLNVESSVPTYPFDRRTNHPTSSNKPPDQAERRS